MDMLQTRLQVNIKSCRARLLLHYKSASFQIERERGGFEMESHPIRLEIDNRAFFDSMGLKSISALAGDLIDRGKQAAQESTARYVREGNRMASPHSEDAISRIAVMRTQKSIESVLAFMPQNPPQCSWTGGWVDISYAPDELQVQWDIGGVEKTYVPYSIDFWAVEKTV